jgi:hypothetical protein
MARIRASMLRDLWQSEGEPPAAGEEWWELWLRPTADAVELVRRCAAALGFGVRDRHLRFADRTVMWIHAKWSELSTLPATAVPLAEIRRPSFIDSVMDLEREDRDTLTDDLAARLITAPSDAPAVCLLDTGVRRTHLLLRDSLAAEDVHSVVGDPTGDIRGHGTNMAGLALFGPLDDPLLSTATVELGHRLESVKFLPDPNQTPHEADAFGLVTAEAVALPEIQAPDRQRVFCLTVTGPGEGAGTPSLWSATLDALASGNDVGRTAHGIELLSGPQRDRARLFVVAAGNVEPEYAIDHLAKCDASCAEDPAQSWNALVVGAMTAATAVPTEPSFDGWSVVAPEGDVSPLSRTGRGFGPRWPIRPDIVMEGGNLLTDGAGDFHDNHPVVSLRTTGRADDAALSTANATSAATAQASRLAARVMREYPGMWPETVRGLLVHSAQWTPQMRRQMGLVGSARPPKRALRQMLQRYGWGVPSEFGLLQSTDNDVTMIVQDEFVPFVGPGFTVPNYRFHELPWPMDKLTEHGEADIELRVTLSYFVEPTAGRRGWRGRYSYASHGLRFDLRATGESNDEFVARLNGRSVDADDDAELPSAPGDRADWLIGPNHRNQGSLHSDLWRSFGAQAAATGGVLAITPIGGWWKNNKRRDRRDASIRYSLLVTLRAATGIDIYSEIQAAIRVPAATPAT